MKYVYYSKTQSFTDAMKEAAEKKLNKLSKFLKDDESVKITVESFKNDKIRVKAQCVLKDNKRIRAEETGHDYYVCLQGIVDSLKDQAVSCKEKHSYKERLSKDDNIPEDIMPLEPVIKKVKFFDIEKMTEGMAVNEMNKLGHDNYIFRNLNMDNRICQIYRRVDGDYSMIVVNHSEE